MGNNLLWNLEVSIIVPAQLRLHVKQKKLSVLVLDLMEQGELRNKLNAITQSKLQCMKRARTHEDLDFASFLWSMKHAHMLSLRDLPLLNSSLYLIYEYRWKSSRKVGCKSVLWNNAPHQYSESGFVTCIFGTKWSTVFQ